MKKCSVCNLEFESHSLYANHVRWNHRDNEESSRKISEKAKERHSAKRGPLKNKEVLCEKCKTPIEIQYYESKLKKFYFCSRKCANSRGPRTDAQKKSISESVKKAWVDGKYSHVDYVSSNVIFTSKAEREIVEYFKKHYPEDLWKSGGNLKFENLSICRDLYSDKLKVCFEYDGVWHFKDIHGQLKDKQKKDAALEKWCVENGYRLIRVEEGHFKNFKQIEELLYERSEPIIKIGNSYAL